MSESLCRVPVMHPGYSSQGGHPGYAGYAPQQQYAPQGPPPGADRQLWQWFSAVDTDRSGAISVTELQSALVNGKSIFRADRGLI